MPLPTFVILGAQKCGTSTLTATLRQHPQVSMSRPKELHFFDRHHQRGLEWYADQFTPKPGETAIGEATPVYLYDAEARHRMDQMLPGARTVVILRDPIKRAYSHFWHSRRNEFEAVDSFEQALALEPARLASGNRSDRIRFSYTDRGHYIDQLLAVEQARGRDTMLVLLLDDLAGDRVPTLERLFGFIDVDPGQAATLPERWTNRYRVAAAPGAKPEPVAYPPMRPETRAMLKETFRESNDRLAAWLGRELSWNDD
ncbi:sulfotransferase domain-containing protein [Nocardioides sp.]|uniref:sulfotransferase domain-containing protein n=1 Tax=Nocardioides sp. TaxID=35761 RepID=UPI0027336752|nr:sulfotransferase domain-containing protein [Nocardioides sp.]MDP3894822.1 sulfotransferase domain-containing protein [Nocardioides sp.]